MRLWLKNFDNFLPFTISRNYINSQGKNIYGPYQRKTPHVFVISSYHFPTSKIFQGDSNAFPFDTNISGRCFTNESDCLKCILQKEKQDCV